MAKMLYGDHHRLEGKEKWKPPRSHLRPQFLVILSNFWGVESITYVAETSAAGTKKIGSH
jgi:hypothetical protein